MKACLTLAEPSRQRLEGKLARYGDRVAFIEVRLDYLKSSEIPLPQANSKARLIATCRPRREGGVYTGSERSRLQRLQEAARKGYHWVDLEWDAEALELPPDTRVVRSSHRLDRLPGDLDAWLAQVRRSGAAVKLAAEVDGTVQAVRLLEWMEKLPEDLPRVVLAMGDVGQPVRYLGSLLGNQWTYVSEPKQPLASGQFSLGDWEEVMGDRTISRSPRVYGVLGKPVAHSLSPRLLNALFAKYGLDCVYFPFHVEDLGAWFGYLEKSRLDFGGFSVTLPHKTGVVPYASEYESPVPAINTLTGRPGDWTGLNTDWDGFLNPLRRQIDLAGKSALVLGNGGVAHTVVRALGTEGVRVVVVGRDPRRVSDFAAAYGVEWVSFADLPKESDILVNTTPVGQYPGIQSSPLTPDQIQSKLVYDLIYNPPETLLLRTARSQARTTISGLEMFVEQAALQFCTWTSIDPDRGEMSAILKTKLAG